MLFSHTNDPDKRDTSVGNLGFAYHQLRDYDHTVEEVIRDIYTPPRNRHEAAIHKQLLDKKHSVLKKGWPDFCVFTQDDFYVVEVKGHGDDLSAAQVVLLNLFPEMGIDAYVARETGYRTGSYFYEAFGDSKPWVKRD